MYLLSSSSVLTLTPHHYRCRKEIIEYHIPLFKKEYLKYIPLFKKTHSVFETHVFLVVTALLGAQLIQKVTEKQQQYYTVIEIAEIFFLLTNNLMLLMS